MSCNNILGITFACDNFEGFGGVDAIFVTYKSSVQSVTVSNDVITNFTMVGGETFKTFDFSNYSANVLEDVPVNRQVSFSGKNITIVANIPKRDTAKVLELEKLEIGMPKLAVIYKDKYDQYWFIEEMQAGNSAHNTGTLDTDSNFFTFTLTGSIRRRYKEVLNTAALAVIS